MSKTNHFICPTCGHDFFDTGAYSTCDACQTLFYVSQSGTRERPHGMYVTPTWIGPTAETLEALARFKGVPTNCDDGIHRFVHPNTSCYCGRMQCSWNAGSTGGTITGPIYELKE